MRFSRIVESSAAMRRLGREMGRVLPPDTVVCLYGDLGAGKTTLTKGIAEGLGLAPRDVCSASFVLCAEHHGGRLPLYHVDLYRLDAEDVEPSGLADYFFTDGVTVIEWAERAAGLLPKKRIEVHIGIRGRSRQVEVKAPGSLLRDGALAASSPVAPELVRR